jgi:hypothetical protein
MNVGTKSLLFGVHAFWYHPYVVGRAYRHIHGVWPMFDEWLCILTHDWGYWGCPNLDGPEGKRHPERGAKVARTLVYWWFRLKMLFWPRDRIQSLHSIAFMYASEAYYRTLYHSSHYARMNGAKPSVLYLPDKASILFEPRWWYLFRAKLSDEVYEYIENSPLSKLPPELRTPEAWYNWYRRKVKEKMSK